MPKTVSRPLKGRHLNTLPDSFVCLDIETTGLSPVYDDIIEVSALRVENGATAESFSEIINIHRPLPPFITSLTGITDAMIAGGSEAEDVLARFLDFTGDSVILGHNVNFDINFLYDNCMARLGAVFGNNYVDTLKLARRLLPGLPHHRLDDLMRYYGVRPRARHRALNDCELTVACYYNMKEEMAYEH
ncbi:MAG: 3'-5' exonuclease [Clostridia bacterium]|nr:3'-5' exonuclease [Clostridia bacterium]